MSSATSADTVSTVGDLFASLQSGVRKHTFRSTERMAPGITRLLDEVDADFLLNIGGKVYSRYKTSNRALETSRGTAV